MRVRNPSGRGTAHAHQKPTTTRSRIQQRLVRYRCVMDHDNITTLTSRQRMSRSNQNKEGRTATPVPMSPVSCQLYALRPVSGVVAPLLLYHTSLLSDLADFPKSVALSYLCVLLPPAVRLRVSVGVSVSCPRLGRGKKKRKMYPRTVTTVTPEPQQPPCITYHSTCVAPVTAGAPIPKGVQNRWGGKHVCIAPQYLTKKFGLRTYVNRTCAPPIESDCCCRNQLK